MSPILERERLVDSRNVPATATTTGCSIEELSGKNEGTPPVTSTVPSTSSSSSSSSTLPVKITQSIHELNYVRKLLYISHILEQFSEKSWVFAIILFMSYVTNYQSLLLVSTYGLVSNTAVCIFASYTGHYIDHQPNRLHVAQFFIWTENFCVILASLFCYLLLYNKEINTIIVTDTIQTSESTSFNVLTDTYSIVLLIGIHILGSIAQILDGGFLVAIERDWVVVLGQVAYRFQLIDQQLQSTSVVEDDIDTITNSIEMPFVKSTYDKSISVDSDSDSDNNSSVNTTTTTKKELVPSQNETTTTTTNTITTTTNYWLSETNVCMKQIDLSCEVLAPAIAGLFITLFGTNSLSNAAIVISIINILSLFVEYICTKQIYNIIPELALPKNISNTNNNINTNTTNEQKETTTNRDSDNNDCSTEKTTTSTNANSNITTASRAASTPTTTTGSTQLLHTFDRQHPLITYFQQPVWSAGIGLAMLYFNALTFGGLMLSYLLYRGMDLSTVGTLRGIASAIGLSGTCIFTISYNITKSLPITGMWSIVYQFICITVSMISMYITDYKLSMILFIIGVCTSRIGLFVYEIAVIQLMQEYIPESIRGNIGGTQNSLNAFFQLSSFALCLIYSNPKDFSIVVAAGYIAVGIACVLFGFGIYKNKSYYENQNNNTNNNINFNTNPTTTDDDDNNANDYNDDDEYSNDVHELTLYYSNDDINQHGTRYELTTV